MEVEPPYPVSFIFLHLATTISPNCQTCLDPVPANAPCPCSAPTSQPRTEVLPVPTAVDSGQSLSHQVTDSPLTPSRAPHPCQWLFPVPAGQLCAGSCAQVHI